VYGLSVTMPFSLSNTTSGLWENDFSKVFSARIHFPFAVAVHRSTSTASCPLALTTLATSVSLRCHRRWLLEVLAHTRLISKSGSELPRVAPQYRPRQRPPGHLCGLIRSTGQASVYSCLASMGARRL